MAYSTGPGPNAPVLALALGALLLAASRPMLRWGDGRSCGAVPPEIGLAAALGTVLVARKGALRAATAAALVGAIAYLPFAIAASPSHLVDFTLGFALDEQRLQRLPFPVAYHGALNPKELFDLYYPAALLAGLALWICAAALQRPPFLLLAAVPLAAAGAAYLLARPDGPGGGGSARTRRGTGRRAHLRRRGATREAAMRSAAGRAERCVRPVGGAAKLTHGRRTEVR